VFNLATGSGTPTGSYRAIPAKFSLLSGRVVVDRGGDTGNSRTCAPPTTALDAATKAEIESRLRALPDVFRAALGFTELTDDERAMFRPVRQRLVRTHPVTGRKSLFLASHIGGIVGWPVPEAARLHPRPREHRDPAAVRLRPQVAAIRPGDVGQPPDHAPGAPLRRDARARRPHRTTVAGSAPTVAQVA